MTCPNYRLGISFKDDSIKNHERIRVTPFMKIQIMNPFGKKEDAFSVVMCLLTATPKSVAYTYCSLPYWDGGTL